MCFYRPYEPLPTPLWFFCAQRTHYSMLASPHSEDVHVTFGIEVGGLHAALHVTPCLLLPSLLSPARTQPHSASQVRGMGETGQHTKCISKLLKTFSIPPSQAPTAVSAALGHSHNSCHLRSSLSHPCICMKAFVSHLGICIVVIACMPCHMPHGHEVHALSSELSYARHSHIMYDRSHPRPECLRLFTASRLVCEPMCSVHY